MKSALYLLVIVGAASTCALIAGASYAILLRPIFGYALTDGAVVLGGAIWFLVFVVSAALLVQTCKWKETEMG